MTPRMNPGDTVTWASRTGSTPAEYRGRTMGLDGWEATIIVRPAGEPPFQITVPWADVKPVDLIVAASAPAEKTW